MKKFLMIAALLAAFSLQAGDSVIAEFGKAATPKQEQLTAKKKSRKGRTRSLVGTYCKMIGRCNVRSGPGENYPVIDMLPDGYMVYVCRQSGNWFLIDLSLDCCDPDCKTYGWTHRQNLRFYANDDLY